MNWYKLLFEASQSINNPEEEVKVYFDFPIIPGGQKEFKIAKVSKNGIMLRNDSVERPVGH